MPCKVWSERKKSMSCSDIDTGISNTRDLIFESGNVTWKITLIDEGENDKADVSRTQAKNKSDNSRTVIAFSRTYYSDTYDTY